MAQQLLPRNRPSGQLPVDVNALERISDIVIISNADHKLTHWSDSAARLYDLPAEQVMGLSLDAIFLRLGASPDQLQQAAEQLAAGGCWHGDVFHRRPDGNRICLDMCIAQLNGPDGTTTGSLILGRDVTQRALTEEALHRTTEQLRTLFEALPVAVIGMNMRGEVEIWSRQAELLFGWTTEEMLGQTIDRIIPPGEQAPLPIARSERATEKVVAGADVKRVCKDGATIDVTAWTASINDAAGKTVAELAIYADATARRKLERQLFQAQRMESIGQLAGGIAHDFNNLLTSIIGNATFARDALPIGDQTRSDVESILRASSKAASLTRQLLAFSRRQMLDPQPTDLNELILSLDKMLRRLIGENIEVTVLPQSNLGRVLADPGQIEQVIINLAVNARDAMPAGGKLTISTANVLLDEAFVASHVGATPGEFVMFAISDTGCGLSDYARAHLFEPFFTTKEFGKGTGLGLATVFGIIKQHNGNIWVESKPNEGATFRIYLPRLSEAESQARQSRLSPAASKRHETILLVEDEYNVRTLAARTLAGYGYKILEAGHGEEALRVARAHKGTIHLLLTDIVMPILGGQELATQLRQERPRMRVLFMSGYLDQTALPDWLQQPGVACIQKPFSDEALCEKVRATLHARLTPTSRR